MSDSQPIDLSELQSLSFRPDWVPDQKPEVPAAGSEIIWNFAPSKGGRQDRGGDRGDRRDRGDRPQNRGPRPGGDDRGRPGGPRPERRDGGRPGGPGGPPRRDGDRPPGGPGAGRPPQNRGPRPEGAPRGPRPDGPPRGPRRDDNNRGPRRENFGPRDRNFDDRPRLPQGWFVRLLPEPRAVEQLAKQIKASGRAYSVFDVAKLFLSARDRYLLHFYHKAPNPNQEQPNDAPQTVEAPSELLQCSLDGSLWLGREEATRHIRESAAMNELYAEEVVDVEPPKGVFQSIAVCGFSGALLGPPNHHSFPINVARLHREEFYNLSLERYKDRIKVEKGEEIVAKWLEQQSKQRQYVALKVPDGEEAPRFKTIAERDAHFFKNHADEVLKAVREVTVGGNIPGKMLSPGLLSVLRMELDRQQRFPIHLVQELCRELENHGLKFFKRDKKSTFVCRSRPQFIGNNIPLSERVRSILEMVRANPGIGYGKVVSLLAPPAPEPEPAPVPEAVEGAEPATPPAPPAPTLSTGELAIMQDIKWLVQEGFITEFANGELHILGRERPQEEPREPRKPKDKAPAQEKLAAEAMAEVTEETPTAEAVETPPHESVPVAEDSPDIVSAIEPEVSPTPSPQISPSPAPEPPPVPSPEFIPSPSPEIAPSPEPAPEITTPSATASESGPVSGI